MARHDEADGDQTPFRWRNCQADIDACRHDVTIELYLADVIVPALATLDAKIALLGESEDAGDVFFQRDVEEVLIETKLAFGLSIQSIWERQLRAYLKGCARELRPDAEMTLKLEKADWGELAEHFLRLRGIRLDAFPSYPALDTLQHLGNACRHGDGASALELARRCPDLWRTYPPLPEFLGASDPLPQTVAMIDLPVARLHGFVAAIAGFWRDATYIYNESIEPKHESLERHLVRERRERVWRPTAAKAQGRQT